MEDREAYDPLGDGYTEGSGICEELPHSEYIDTMKTLLRQDIPEDFSYYRTGSRVFYEYYKNSSHKMTVRL